MAADGAPGRAIPPDPDYPEIEQVIQSWLHQDMALFHPTMSDALAEWAGTTDAATRAAVVAEIDLFLVREAAALDAAFVSRWGWDVHPPEMGRSSIEFLEAMRTIARDPAAAARLRSRW